MQPENNTRKAYRGRLFPEIQWSLEKIAQSKAENQAIYQHCRVIFERVKSQFIKTHYNWFIAIEPNSEEYVIEKDEQIATKKLCQKHPNAIPVLFKLNETGACGTI
ncbi:hypothetical protein [Candidatus Parabeggiatoa sp. HSG14]|uniref:hypothetical protein n=1 Tax=Candidatus Parabeggiatoa sp. HSG14 TaxID=3055593 RepID=UPI0025A7DEF7|nr:hypothetical protein [Thiotrichales bacterium HSG14]